MADSNQKPSAAKNELGELYVEFGSKGLNVLTKGLGSLSTGFNLAVAGAKKAADEIIKMSENAGKNVTGLDKISTVTGMTVDQLQKLKAWAQVNNVEFDKFIGQIETLQQAVINARMGGKEAQGLAKLGLSTRDLDFNEPIKALDTIRQKIQQLQPVEATWALTQLGLSQDMLYAFQQGNESIDQRLLLTDQELGLAREQQQEWNKLKATWDAAQQKFITNQGWVNNAIEKTIDLITEFVLSANKLEALKDIFGQIGDIIFVKIYGAIYKSSQLLQSVIKDPVHALKNIGDFLFTEKTERYQKDMKLMSDYRKTHNIKGAMTPEEAEAFMKYRRQSMQQEQVKAGNITLSKGTSGQRHNQDVPVAVNNLARNATKINTSLPAYVGSDIKMSNGQAREIQSSYNLPPLPAIAQQAVNNNQNQSKNVTVNITQNVTGNNAQDVANNAGAQIKQYFNSIQYSNVTGI